MKANHEDRKIRFESQIKSLQDRLKEKEDEPIIETFNASNKENTSLNQGANKKPAGGKEEFSNPTAVLKLRLNRWVSNNRDKKHLMDVYSRNVHIIEDSFT